MKLRWKRNGTPGQLESVDGRFWLVNHAHYSGKRSTTWNVLRKNSAGGWECDDSGSSLAEAKLIAESSSERA